MGIRSVAVGVLVLASRAAAQEVEWIRPSNTGIPGEEVRRVAFHPDGRLWVGARWPFWDEGGVGIYDIAQDLWETHSNAPNGSGKGPLPSEFINDIEFEPDGTAWISTNEGLVRYDGTDWEVFDSTNTPMAFNKCRAVSIGPDGHVWVNNSDFNQGGDSILEFDGTAWTKYRTGMEMPWDTIWTDLSSVFVASNGDVWVGNDTLTGAARLHNGVWTLYADGIGAFDGFVEDQMGNVYCRPAFNHTKLGKWNGSSFSTQTLELYTTCMAVDDNGAVYYGNWNGDIRRSTNQGGSWSTFISGLNILTGITPAPSGDFWIGTLGALGHFNAGGQFIKDYNTITTGMPDYFCQDFHLGRTSGRFYIASMETGASVFDGQRWDNVGSHNHNINWPVLADGADSVYEASDGKVWVGSNGILRWDTETGAMDLWDWRNTSGMGVANFSHFAEDMNGRLLSIERYGNSWWFDPGANAWTKDTKFMYSAGSSPGVEADSQGNLYWAGWFDVTVWDGSAWTDIPLPYNDFLYDLGGASCVAIGPDDTLWVGCPDGLAHWDGADWEIFDATNTPMIVDAVWGIDFRDDGLLGITMSDLGDRPNSGAAIIDGPLTDPANWSFYTYGAGQIPHPQITGCAFDGNGDLWVNCISEAASVIKLGGTACAADFNGDGSVNTQDVLAFLNAWAAGDTSADFNEDGTINTQDVLVFLNAWTAGC